MDPLIKSNKRLRNFYLSQLKSYNTQEDFQINKLKWDKVIKNSINIKGWETVYKICFECLDFFPSEMGYNGTENTFQNRFYSS